MYKEALKRYVQWAEACKAEWCIEEFMEYYLLGITPEWARRKSGSSITGFCPEPGRPKRPMAGSDR